MLKHLLKFNVYFIGRFPVNKVFKPLLRPPVYLPPLHVVQLRSLLFALVQSSCLPLFHFLVFVRPFVRFKIVCEVMDCLNFRRGVTFIILGSEIRAYGYRKAYHSYRQPTYRKFIQQVYIRLKITHTDLQHIVIFNYTRIYNFVCSMVMLWRLPFLFGYGGVLFWCRSFRRTLCGRLFGSMGVCRIG